AARPNDVPTLLALADAYRDEGRLAGAAATYQRVLAIERGSVPALNGLGLILFRSGELDGAILAADRVLVLRPRDADALFLKGLALYRKEDWRGAVAAWSVYLDVGEFHPAAGMVRPLYEDARRKSGGG
ncbi:MAG: tetratricopeptide repeat protein, partial [Candidatus Limnocylindria bacterium]